LGKFSLARGMRFCVLLHGNLTFLPGALVVPGFFIIPIIQRPTESARPLPQAHESRIAA
jgi:hypothetical protein